MAIDMFETRTMIQMLEQMTPARTFLKDTFFGRVRTFDTEHVDIDIYKGKRRMAPFVSPVIGGKTVERLGYRTNTYKPPLIAPDMITTAADLLKRAPGETVYGTQSPNERMAMQLGRDMAELDNLITRREEWMCAKALFTGQIQMVGEGLNEIVSFDLDATHKITLGGAGVPAKWGAQGATVLKNLRDWRRLVIQDSGVSPNVIVMGTSAIDKFIEDDSVMKALDNRRIDRGQIDPSVLPSGVTYWGYIKEVACDIYSYDEWYLDDAGAEQPMVPANQVLVSSSSARMEMLYGAVLDVDLGTFALPRVPKSWTVPKPSARFVQLRCRPLPVPVQIDAVVVATVV